MNFLQKYVLTKTQKSLLLTLVIVLIGAGYYLGFYLPVQQRIAAADTAELDDQIALEQMKAARIKQMQAEIEENKANNAPMVPAYNHFKAETEELNRIFGKAYNFSFVFAEPQVDGMQIRRAMNVTFDTDSYDAAVSMLHEVVEGPYRCMIQDLSIMDNAGKLLQNEELDIRKGSVSVSFQLTYFETRYDADTEEGLPAEKETEAASGLANADVSNLERSDLETAAEAALGE